MREIKFRAWDNVKDRMYFVGEEDDISFELCSGGSFVGHDLKEDWDSPFQRLEHLQYMQYIGLKDKNGTKIYESDVIEDSHTKYIVEYEEEGAQFILVWCNNEDRFDPFPLDMNTLKVIGNIYENPELLEVRP